MIKPPEQQLELEVANGEWSKQILDNPLYRQYMTARKATLLDAFSRTSYKQDDERKEIWRKLQALDDMAKDFERYLVTGKMAQQGLLQKVKTRMGIKNGRQST